MVVVVEVAVVVVAVAWRVVVVLIMLSLSCFVAQPPSSPTESGVRATKTMRSNHNNIRDNQILMLREW